MRTVNSGVFYFQNQWNKKFKDEFYTLRRGKASSSNFYVSNNDVVAQEQINTEGTVLQNMTE